MACKSYCQRFRSNKNIVKRAVFFSEYSGESCQSDFQLAANIYEEEIDPVYVKLLHALDEESVKSNCGRVVRSTVKSLKALRDYRLKQTSDDFATSVREWFFLDYIPDFEIKMLFRILMTTSILTEERAKLEDGEDDNLYLKALIIEFLCQLSSIDIAIGETVASRDDLLIYLFKLLQHQQSFIKSCDLMEFILLYRNGTFKLNTIGNITDIIKNFEDYQLTNFSRVLALAISNEDSRVCLYAKQQHRELKTESKVHEHNQDLVLSIPNILSRLVTLCTTRPYIPPAPKNLSELDHWMIWIDRSLDVSVNLEEFIEKFILELANGRPSDALFRTNLAVRMSYNLSYKIKVFHVIGILLSGRHRKMILKQLMDLKLIPQLSNLFDDFDWKTNNELVSSVTNRRAVISECPEVALKIQLLRLVHNFCDSEYKHLMLTPEEFQDIKNLQLSISNNIDLHKDDKSDLEDYCSSLMCEGEMGFLNKIIKVMTDATTHPSYLFWLSRIVESYLRGTMVYADQLFLLHKGLLTYILNKLMFNGSELEKEHRQCFFDLLGELMKFNVEVITAFSQFINTELKFRLFSKTMTRSLIDSNMFIRSMILSLDHLENKLDVNELSKLSDSPVEVFKSTKNRINFLYQLLQIIDVESLTQENISCLNTSLVFLMLANKKSKMPLYLSILGRVEKNFPNNDQHGSSLLNLREMLLFWQKHYFLKEMEKDCNALEKNCRIKFDYWIETVEDLVNESEDSPLSLLHYINEGRNES